MRDTAKSAGQGDAPSFVTASMGCRVNQAEAAWLAQGLTRLGWRRAGSGQKADLAVLMTCSVTGQAARQSRQMARRLLAAHPGARVVVSGCDLQVEPEAYIAEGATPLGRSQLTELTVMAQGGMPWPGPQAPGPPGQGDFCPGVEAPGPRRTRGLIKVQDGCAAFCAYCIVPMARGGPRSLALDEAARCFAGLGRQGASEVVLTGIHLGRYGRDLPEKPGLDRLVKRLLAAHAGPRLRLSSLEVSEIGGSLLGLMQGRDRLCPHLHIPLQSGSDKVLSAMGRPYTSADYAQKVLGLYDAMEGLAIGADVLVGLPSEDEQAFRETYTLIERLPLAYLHVFPYSPRPGTRAAAMKNAPYSKTAKKRAAALRELGNRKRVEFHQSQVGRSLSVVVEGSGLGRSENYCLVKMGRGHEQGSSVRVRVTGVELEKDAPRLVGEPV